LVSFGPGIPLFGFNAKDLRAEAGGLHCHKGYIRPRRHFHELFFRASRSAFRRSKLARKASSEAVFPELHNPSASTFCDATSSGCSSAARTLARARHTSRSFERS
jgi:hypothetical protein